VTLPRRASQLIDIDQWRVFISIANLGSLSKAASTLNEPISAVSRQLASLEKSLGAALFSRSGHGMVISGFGERIRPQVETFLREAQALRDFVSTQVNAEAQRISVGLVSSVAPYFVAPIVTGMRKRYPLVRLNLVEFTTGQLVESIGNGSLDLAVMYRAPRHLSLTEEVLMTVKYGLLIPLKSPLAGRTIVRTQELSGVPLVLPPGETAFNQAIRTVCDNLGITLHLVAEVESVNVIRALVRAGICCAIVNPAAFRHELQAKIFNCATLTEPEITLELSLCRTRERPLSEPIRECIRLIEAIAHQFGP
jgi:LysR family nitrogen assimilation transcriptional regulator